MPQVFETAIKEVIEIPESSPFNASATTVVHSFGYPLGFDTKGGGFLYKNEGQPGFTGVCCRIGV